MLYYINKIKDVGGKIIGSKKIGLFKCSKVVSFLIKDLEWINLLFSSDGFISWDLLESKILT